MDCFAPAVKPRARVCQRRLPIGGEEAAHWWRGGCPPVERRLPTGGGACADTWPRPGLLLYRARARARGPPEPPAHAPAGLIDARHRTGRVSLGRHSRRPVTRFNEAGAAAGGAAGARTQYHRHARPLSARGRRRGLLCTCCKAARARVPEEAAHLWRGGCTPVERRLPTGRGAVLAELRLRS